MRFLLEIYCIFRKVRVEHELALCHSFDVIFVGNIKFRNLLLIRIFIFIRIIEYIVVLFNKIGEIYSYINILED